MPNKITEENALTSGRADKSYWDASHSNLIEGFTTDFSVNAGQTVSFKINVNGTASQTLPYKIEIFRLGYYGGSGAREVAEFVNADGTVQPQALFDESRGLVDAGNWSITDSWQIPADAVSGVYLARLQRLDANGNPIEGATNQIPFIVRNDGDPADIVLQTSDTTWQAYNGWAGNNGLVGPNFYGDPANMVDHDPVASPGLGQQDRAYAVSYNRPFLTRDGGGAAAGAQDYLFGADYAAVYWLEKNGYDVSYISGVDTDRLGADYLKNYKAYISVGHDEYWSGGQRANVEAARDAGVNLLFWSGNEVYWKTRWEDAISADGTPYRTLVSYKETWANGDPNAGPADYANIDPSNEWTGTWRDMRFVGNPGATGQRPENSLTGQMFGPDGTGEFGGALDVPASYAGLRYWRNTSVAANNGAADLAPGLIGYEWNVVPEDQYRPGGLIKLSETTLNWSEILVDQGNRTEPGTATHNLSLYRDDSGALVFGSGTVFWAWALSNEHDSSPYGANAENTALKQFTVNLFADMGIQPASLEAGLTAATASTDKIGASVTINDVADEVAARAAVTITGTATDNDGNPATADGTVALVELSFDGGQTWKVASGTTNWSYTWRPVAEGNVTVMARAVDDSLNVYNATPDTEAVTVTSAIPPNTFSLFDPAAPIAPSAFADGQQVEVGMRFSVDRSGDVTQLRYYRGAGDSADTDTRDGHIWRVSDGALLGTVTFVSGPGESGWQIANLSTPVTLQPGVEYVVSYRTADNYVSTNGFFASANEVTFDGIDNDAFTDPFGVISAPENALDKGNGVFRYGSDAALPTNTFGSSNYWVDITFDPADGGVNSAPVITSGNFTLAENQAAAGTVTATDADANPLAYAIAGGTDAGLFTIDAGTGALSFKSAPDFEAPGDAGANNVYDVTVSVTDGLSAPVTKAMTVSVTNVDEGGGAPGGSFLFDQTPTNFVSGASDATNYELGTKFLSSQDGTITALRYYRGAADADDTDVRTLRLWDSSGNLLGSAEATSAPSQTGWQVATLTTPVAITAGQTYVVSYGYVYNNGQGNVESYAASPNYFGISDAGPDNILTAPASGAPSGPSSGGIGNGLFAVGTPGAFPTQSFNASNYWVDVLFQPAGTGGGNQPPAFTSPAIFEAPENQTAIATVTASDADANPLTFSIVGGADAGLFTIGATSGRLEFRNPQDFEGADNVFEVTLGVSDGTNPVVMQTVSVSLTDVDETAAGPAALTGRLLRADYIFGATATTLFPGAGASQTATVGDVVEFPALPSAGPDVGNNNLGLAAVDARAQTVRIEFPLDPGAFANQSFVRLAGPSDGRPYNGVLLADADGTLPTIRSARIIGQEGFTTSTGTLQALTASDLTVTADGIFLNVADKGRLVDVDPDTAGAQPAWVELLVELNDVPTLAAPLLDQTAKEDDAFSYTVPAGAFLDADGDPLAYVASGPGGAALPPWLSFDPVNGTFAGTPGDANVGTLTVTITASDGTTEGIVSDSFDITVASANAAPTDIALSATSVSEKAAGAEIGTLTTQDPDPGDSFTYELSDSRFEVVKNGTGADVLKLKTGQSLNYDTAQTVTLEIRSTDTGGLSTQQSFVINVMNVADNRTQVMTTTSFTAPTDDNWTVTGTTGADTIVTLGGRDTINAKNGNDTISTGGGDDTILFAGTAGGSDAVDGGAGSDTLRATGANTLIGLRSLAGVEIITSGGFSGVKIGGSSAADTLDFSTVQLIGITRIEGGGGNDAITGSAAADMIVGGGGDDTLRGGGGADIFQIGTGSGFDHFDGGSEADTIIATAANVVIGIRSLSGIETISSGGSSGVRISGSTVADTLDFSNVQLTGITRIDGGSGNDIISGSVGADTILAGAGDDVVSGGGGADIFQVGSGAGADSFDGGSESDTIIATASTTIFLRSIANVEVISNGGFAGVYIGATAGNDTLDFANVQLVGITRIDGGGGHDVITGSASANTINGGGGNDTLNGGGGNDTIQADSGNDLIVQLSTQGRDFVNGSTGTDTYQLNGDPAAAESFTIYTRAAWDAVVGNELSALNAATEIVVTRNGSDAASIIAELDNVEEININSLAVSANDGNGVPNGGAASPGDTVAVVGNFTETSLNFSTITVNGGPGRDTVDISGLTSAHRLVFTTGGGDDEIIGALRPQDIIDGVSAGEVSVEVADIDWNSFDFTPDLVKHARFDFQDDALQPYRDTDWSSLANLIFADLRPIADASNSLALLTALGHLSSEGDLQNVTSMPLMV